MCSRLEGRYSSWIGTASILESLEFLWSLERAELVDWLTYKHTLDRTHATLVFEFPMPFINWNKHSRCICDADFVADRVS